ncbi:DUF362 domain-containing protein [Candidatus Poribacteria bacterium]
MEVITRRVFLKRTVSGVGGIVLAKSLGAVSVAQIPAADMSRVVVAEHHQATDGVRIVNAANVQSMTDESIKQLTGEASVANAWASLLPDFRKEHVVAVKVNAINALLPTHPAVVDAITSGLIASGVPENNIIIYDALKTSAWKQRIINAGYEYNAGDTGVRCIETNEKGWGYDWDNPVTILGRKMALSSVVTRCDHLINVPVLKWLNWTPAPTLGLKNHYGSINAPDGLHGNFATACATLNSQDAIKNKTRLSVIDALFGCSTGQLNPPNFAPNSLIVSRDSVAADYVAADMLNEERVRLKLALQRMLYIEEAAGMGLGTGDPEKMELIKLELGAPEKEEKEEVEEKPEEEVGKAVDPAHSYKTQWGSIKLM